MKTISIEAIRIDRETQSRAEIHNDTVAEYADALESGTTLPPIIVFFDGVDYWLGDGFHRVHAFRQAGRASINADVREGTQSDAQLFSYGVNTDHGLRRTNADKRKAVTGALQHPVSCKWSDNQIAKHCGVSDKTVSAVRTSIFGNSEDAKPTERTVTRGGTTYTQNTENIGGKKKAGEAVNKATVNTGVNTAGAVSSPFCRYHRWRFPSQRPMTAPLPRKKLPPRWPPWRQTVRRSKCCSTPMTSWPQRPRRSNA
ncbi:ParB N-terminal domain-containing protein [Ottowia beijingensis]|uniref:ParB N-terminal domain-containing protein n=1 Tax=Ottowia beijingensis TaxID=1207057 RepID=A0A853IUX7_9BURK|nr:ParB N-terminal domain-containing protein [Ottowia beijingensis]NZA01197.1 ParB N-terminal domain-containing protein [Ottowia beijingensis]